MDANVPKTQRPVCLLCAKDAYLCRLMHVPEGWPGWPAGVSAGTHPVCLGRLFN